MTNAISDLAAKEDARKADRAARPRLPLPPRAVPYVRWRRRVSATLLIAISLTFIGGEYADFLSTPTASPSLLLAAVLLVAPVVAFNWWIPRYELPPEFRVYRGRKARTPLGRFLLKVFGLPVMGLFFLLGGLNLLGMAAVLADGHPTSVVVTVSDPDPGYHRGGCSGEIQLNAPFFGSLCGQPAYLRDTLHPGDKLRLSGTGTAWGLFYDKVTPVHG